MSVKSWRNRLANPLLLENSLFVISLSAFELVADHLLRIKRSYTSFYCVRAIRGTVPFIALKS
jgi:hypothetical protein